MNAKVGSLSYCSDCETRAFYLRSSDDTIFVWQHTPRLLNIKNKIILICPAIGHEYKHAYRSLRRLADYLCAQGFIVFRFDYSGSGNSTGTTLSDDCFQHWIENIKTLSENITTKFPGFKQSWVGLRLGGTLATLAAKEDVVDTLILWEPIIKGRSYIREQEAISLFSSTEISSSEDYLETAGFMLSKRAAEKIKIINLSNKIQISPNIKALQLVRSDKPTDYSFAAELRKQGIDIHIHPVDDYVAMMAEPQKTIVPMATIKFISEWLGHSSKEVANNVTSELSGNPVLRIVKGNNTIEEQPFCFANDKSLFGVLTKSINKSINSSYCIILANSGSVHHAGPNSIYTLIARVLGELGYFVFRIDLENIGDSHVLEPCAENHPYQPNAVENIQSAIEFIKQHTSVDKFILCGLCSGAHTTFHAALELTNLNICKVLIINPLTFYWQPNMSLDTPPTTLRLFRDQSYYKQSIYSLGKWKKLLTGKADIGRISGFLFKRSVELLQRVWRDNHSLIMGERTPLALDLLKLHENSTSISFIFSSADPGLDIIKSQASRTLKKGIKEHWINVHIIDGADHTFSKKTARDNLLSELKKCLIRE